MKNPESRMAPFSNIKRYAPLLLYVRAIIILVLSAIFVAVNSHRRALDTAGDPLQARADLAARQER